MGNKNIYLYLDHNIYIEALENEELYRGLLELRDKGIQCLYSPAHIEEIYKVDADEKSKNRDKMGVLMNLISQITSNNEVFPTEAGLVITNEHPIECYDRVARSDTRTIVKNDSYIRFIVDNDNYKNLLKADKHNSSISNIEPKKIWDNPVVKYYVDCFNKNIDKIIEKNNKSFEVQVLKLCGVDKELPATFGLKRDNFPELEISHKQLEYTIEILFRILNHSGYYAEKSERTSVSGTHDVSHAIYATKANSFITMDERFSKKCKAVYSFLGIRTDVVYCKQGDILNVINCLRVEEIQV